MHSLNKILIVIENNTKEQPALNRALQLAEKAGSEVILFSTVYDESVGNNSVLPGDVKDSMKAALLENCQNFLEEQKNIINKTSIKANTIIKWCANPLVSLHETCHKVGDIDLIVKTSRHHNLIQKKLFTPLDWNLIRHSPAPILLVKSDDLWTHHHQVLALDSTSEELEHKELNTKLLNIANLFSTTFDLKTHLANAYPRLTSILALPYSRIPVKDLEKVIADGHREATANYAESYGIPIDNQHVWGGEPSSVIPGIAQECNADLIIIGTVARDGLSNMLVGNTSEKIIDKLNADVLIINPSHD